MRQLREIPLDLILEGTNVREAKGADIGELMASMEGYDVLAPILVVPDHGKFRVIAGHRRLMALQLRNEATAPCLIRDDISPGDEIAIQLIENTHRRDMDAEEIVRAADIMKKRLGITSDIDISLKLGKSRGWLYQQRLVVKTRQDELRKGIGPTEVKKIGVGRAIRINTAKNRPEVAFRFRKSSAFSIQIQCRDAVVLNQMLGYLSGKLLSYGKSIDTRMNQKKRAG